MSKQPKDDCHEGIEELPDNHPDVLAFQRRAVVITAALPLTVAEKLAIVGLTVAELKAELAK